MKVFYTKLGGVASFGSNTSKQSVKVFSVKILFPPHYESLPLYGIRRESSLRMPESHFEVCSTYC